MNNLTGYKTRFNYVVTMDERIDPRYIVDHMAHHQYYNAHLVSVTDLQSNTRVTGYAYRRKQSGAGAAARPTYQRSFWRDIGKELVAELKRFV